jgi:hypothetical protein
MPTPIGAAAAVQDTGLSLVLKANLKAKPLDAFAGPPGTQGELEVLSYGSVVPDECPSHKLNKETSFEI